EGERAVRPLEREELGRGMVRALLAEARVLRPAHGRREPYPALPVEHPVVVVGLGVPELLLAPVRRRRHRLLERGVPGPERLRRVGVAHRRPERRHGVRLGIEYPVLDPKTHTVTTFRAPVRDADTPEALGPGHAALEKPMAPSAYWGEEKLWDTRANNHNSMFDNKGRLWLSATVRGMDNPAFCKQGSDHPSAKVFPLEKSARQVAMLDPKTMKYSFIDTCFATHHPQFGYDANDTLWLSGTGPVAGW